VNDIGDHARFARLSVRDIGPVTLGLLCFAGQFKALSVGPVDITVLLALVVFVASLSLVFLSPTGAKASLDGAFLAVVLLFSLFLLPVFWTSWFQYTIEKVPRLFSLTLISSVGGALFLRTISGRRAFLLTVTAAALLTAASAAVSIFTKSADLRVTGGSASQIATGNAFGILLIAALAMVAHVRSARSLLFAVGAVPLLLVGLVAAGARSALVAVVVAALVLTLKNDDSASRRRMLIALFVAAVGSSALLWLFARDLPFSSVLRIIEFVQGETGTGGEVRRDYFAKSVGAIPYYPWGTGWGGFAILLEGTTERSFPHNLLLEITLEAGWLAGGVFAFLMVRGLWSVLAAEQDRSWTSSVFSATLVFAVVSSFVTGEVNDSRWLFATLFGAMTTIKSRMRR
jgi:O-antigen ligase